MGSSAQPSPIEVVYKATELAKYFLTCRPDIQFEVGTMNNAFQPSGIPLCGVIIRRGLCSIANDDELMILSYPLSAYKPQYGDQFGLFETNKLALTQPELGLLWANFTFFISSFTPDDKCHWS